METNQASAPAQTAPPHLIQRLIVEVKGRCVINSPIFPLATVEEIRTALGPWCTIEVDSVGVAIVAVYAMKREKARDVATVGGGL